MTAQALTTSQKSHNFQNKDLRQEQNGRPGLLQLPLDVLNLIGEFVVTGPSGSVPSHGFAAKNALRFGRVCTLTHLLTHTKAIEQTQLQYKLIIKMNELVNAILDRGETPAEAELANLTIASEYFTFNQPSLNAAKDRLEACYAVFKEKATKSGIKESSDEFAVQSVAFQENIQALLLANCDYGVRHDLFHLGIASIPIRTETTLMAFSGKTIKDMIAEYTSQPLSSITIESFKKKVEDIERIFAKVNAQGTLTIDHIYIESKMRKAIKAKHADKEFDEIIASHSDQTIVSFYSELGQDIGKGMTKITHAHALQAIIDSASNIIQRR